MRFAAPSVLYTLFLLLPVLLYLVWEQRRRESRLRLFADVTVWKSIAPELDLRARLRKGLIWTTAIAFVIIALARPQWGKIEETVKISGMDILLVFDVSNSMEVEDVVPSRLKKAKHFVRGLIERLNGDRMGVVAFAGSAYLASPLTNDLSYVGEAVDTLSPKSITNQGTDIGAALDTAARALERGAEETAAQSGNAATGSPPSRVVILISDGEDLEEKAQEGARKLKEAGARLYVLGVGTEKGGPIPTRDENGQLFGYKRNRKGEAVVSHFSPEALKAIAATVGGKYWTMSPDETELGDLLKDLGEQQRTDYMERRRVTYEERYQIFLMIALLLLFLEMSLPARKIRKQSSAKGALVALLAGVLFAGVPNAVAADGVFGPDVSLRGYLKNHKGVKAYEKGDVAAAKELFETAGKSDPTRPEVLYNQGSAQLKAGDAESAQNSFAAAAQKALEANDADTWGRSQLALGNSYAAKGNAAEAVNSYLKALDAARVSKNQPLDAAARKNLQLLASQPPPPPQKSQGDKNKEDQKKNDPSKSQDSKSGDQKQNGKEEKSDPSKKDKDPSKQDGDKEKDKKNQPDKQFGQNAKWKQFKGDKLSGEDAERVMAELANREQALQERLRKQKGGPRSSGDKDW